MIEPTPPDDKAEDQRPNVAISASGQSIAANRIDTLIVQAAAELKAATTVLPIDAMVVDGPPFVGRETEMRQVTELLSAEGDGANNILVVSGSPGVGKTALISEAARAIRNAGGFSEVLFVDLRGYAEDSDAHVMPDAVYSKLLLLLGVDDEDISVDPAVQAIQYQDHLNSVAAEGKSILLWLDNASDRSQFDLLRPASPVHKVAITTRETFGHIPTRQVIDIEPLSLSEAVALLSASAQDRNPTDRRFVEQAEASEKLAELCDRLPLALQIVAALLADELERPIAELVTELKGEEDRLNSLDYSRDLSVRAAFALSYKRLPENLQRLFRLLSVVPGGDVGWDTAGWLVGAAPQAVRPQLMNLVRSHLVLQHVRNRWSMHDLIRLYSAELSANEPGDASQAFDKITRRYLVGVAAAAEWLTMVVSDTAKGLFTSPEHAAAWFEAERATAIAIVISLARKSDQIEMTLAFTIALGELLKSQHHWLNDFHAVTAVGASVAERSSNKRGAVNVLNLYGAALRNMGRFDDALEVLQHALDLSDQNGDASGASAARTNMGNVYFNQGRIDDALEIYWEDVHACRESDPPHPYDEAIALSNIGAALGNARRYDEALPPLRGAIEIRRRLGDTPGIASAAKNLGGVLIGIGREQNSRSHLEEALGVLQEAAEIYQQRGNISGSADIANNSGQAQCLLGQFDVGLTNLLTALTYFEQSGQDGLAAQVREDIEFFQQRAARPSGGGVRRPAAVASPSWSVEDLGDDRHEFTNATSGTLAMIVLFPIGATTVKVEDGVADDPHVVPTPVRPGQSFIAMVRGTGVRVRAAAVPSMASVTWDFRTG